MVGVVLRLRLGPDEAHVEIHVLKLSHQQRQVALDFGHLERESLLLLLLRVGGLYLHCGRVDAAAR
eukprot:2614939-Pyramimonas_sp.AAC.1